MSVTLQKENKTATTQSVFSHNIVRWRFKASMLLIIMTKKSVEKPFETNYQILPGVSSFKNKCILQKSTGIRNFNSTRVDDIIRKCSRPTENMILSLCYLCQCDVCQFGRGTGMLLLLYSRTCSPTNLPLPEGLYVEVKSVTWTIRNQMPAQWNARKREGGSIFNALSATSKSRRKQTLAKVIEGENWAPVVLLLARKINAAVARIKS